MQMIYRMLQDVCPAEKNIDPRLQNVSAKRVWKHFASTLHVGSASSLKVISREQPFTMLNCNQPCPMQV